MVKFVTTFLLAVTLLAGNTYAGPPDWLVRIFVNEDGPKVGEGMFSPESLGSGVLVAEDLVVTNNHVVRDALKGRDQVQVMFPDWSVAGWAEVIKTDPENDLALIRIKTTKRTPVKLDKTVEVLDSGTIHGYAYGLYGYGSGTVTGHALAISEGEEKGHSVVELTGISARLGDSGGGVVNSDGELIGITSMSDQVSVTYFIPTQKVIDLMKLVQ